MTLPSFSLRKDDLVLSDPEAFADRLAEFLRLHVRPDDGDRDLVLMFVDRLFLGLSDDFEDEELMRGAHVQFAALNQEQVVSLRAMQARANETLAHEAMAHETGTNGSGTHESRTHESRTHGTKPVAMAAKGQ